MKIRSVFYKAKRDGHVLDDGISAWTKLFNWGTGPYSHVEIWWDWLDKFVIDGEIGGLCYTSTMRGRNNGTVIRPACDVFKNPNRWDYAEFEVPKPNAAHAVLVAKREVNRNEGYDKATIASFFWPWRFGSKTKAICSERGYQFLWDCDLFPKRDRTKRPSPRRLSRWIEDLGVEIRPLEGD